MAGIRCHSALLLGVLLLAGCPRESKPRPDTRAARPPDAARAAARFEPCATLKPDKAAPAAHIFGLKLVPDGPVLRAADVRPSGARRIALGVLADTKEALPRTLEQLRRLVHRFRRLGVSAIVVLGGLDKTFEGARSVLGVLKEAGPVLAMPGDRESRSGFQAAAEAHFPGVVDLVRVRGLSTPWLGLVAVPGYHLPHHLLAKEQGCSYDEETLRALVGLARKLPGPRLLLAHGPPRGEGKTAVDRAFGQVNIGDPLLRRLLREGDFRFGLFGHVHESSGHATTIDGEPVAEMTWSPSLLLNVGSADSVPHEALGGQWSRGTAAVFELQGERARYRMIDLSRLGPVPEDDDGAKGPN